MQYLDPSIQYTVQKLNPNTLPTTTQIPSVYSRAATPPPTQEKKEVGTFPLSQGVVNQLQRLKIESSSSNAIHTKKRPHEGEESGVSGKRPKTEAPATPAFSMRADPFHFSNTENG